MAAREPGRARAPGTRLPRAARRAQILEAAQDVFVHKGYHGSGMEDIAERAGVSKPVLYQHFPGKLELYLALVDKHTEALVEMVKLALHSTDDHKQRTYATIATYFDFVAREDGAFRLIFESDLRAVTAVQERILWCERVCTDAIARQIVADAGLPLEVARLVAFGLTGMAEVAARTWLREGALLPKEVAARIVGRLAWLGVGQIPAAALRSNSTIGALVPAGPRPAGIVDTPARVGAQQ